LLMRTMISSTTESSWARSREAARSVADKKTAKFFIKNLMARATVRGLAREFNLDRVCIHFTPSRAPVPGKPMSAKRLSARRHRTIYLVLRQYGRLRLPSFRHREPHSELRYLQLARSTQPETANLSVGRRLLATADPPVTDRCRFLFGTE